MKKVVLMLLVSFALYACNSNTEEKYSEKKMDEFIDKLMSEMTLEEKIGQLNLPGSGDITTGQAKNTGIADKIRKGHVGALFNIKGVDKIKEVQRIAVEESRMKIPMLFAMDVIHGYETVFPIPLGLAASFDMEAVEESARIAAVEASADGICWTFSPMADICRDPRWGRMAEGPGEDSYLGSQISKAMVYGYQGKEKKYESNKQIMACVKHYALYGASEAGRDYNTVDMSRTRMFNEYMEPYKAAIDAGAASVMASFNEVDGVPATGNKWLLDDVLREQWGFGGFVVTDYTGINEMVDHGIGDLETVSARALEAGIDLDMVGEGFLTTLKKSVDEGKISVKLVDQACRRILEAKYKLGLFDNPYKYCNPERAKNEIYTEEHRAIARKIAAESFVLLKNDKNILPLKKEGTIAVIGPMANDKSNIVGTWSVAADFEKPTTIVDAIKSVAGPNVNILTAKGSNFFADAALEERSTMADPKLRDTRSEKQMLDEALVIARRADVIVATVGEASEMSGESSSRSEITIPEVQVNLLKELLKTGKPVVLILSAGRSMDISWASANIPSILNVWFGGTEAGYAIADVLFGDVNPSGKLPVTFPRNLGQVPIFYNHKNTGRPLAEGIKHQKYRSNYLDITNDPLYPFGYGLSYTEFSYSDITLSNNKITKNGDIIAKVKVTNSGKYAGKEVVQLYIRDVVGSVTRPIKELKGFQKIHLNVGETKEVTFKVSTDMLRFYDNNLNYNAEPGEFELMIGTDSQNLKKTKFEL